MSWRRKRRDRATIPAEDDGEPGPGTVSASVPEPWRSGLLLALSELESADPLYRPTAFWQPGVRRLLGELADPGIDSFKSWRSARSWFYPVYAPVLGPRQFDAALPKLREIAPGIPEQWFRRHLRGIVDAERDLDVVMAQLDPRHLPIDPTQHGESEIGRPPQLFHPLGPDGPGFGRPFLKYLKVVSALSRHLDGPIRTVLEIGGGFGVLGEILLGADPTVQYVDVDIPPLSTIAHHYLARRFPDLRFTSNLDVSNGTAVTLQAGGSSAVITPWQLPMVSGGADLFVNTTSFQEMEPHVVSNYVDHVVRLQARYVVSMNSREGKPLRSERKVGVIEQVTSEFISSRFRERGYDLVARVGRPAAPPQAELVILRRRG